MKYARINDQTAIEVIDVPDGKSIDEFFHPEIVVLFSPCADDVVVGSTVDENGEWVVPVAPETPEPISTPAPKLSPIQFKLLFTVHERIKIKNSEDEIVKDLFSVIDDPRLTEVDLNLQSTKEAIGYLAMIELIEESRVQEILSATVK